MGRTSRLLVAAALLAAGLVLAVLARDGECTASLPPLCSRSYGVTSALCLAGGLAAAALWLKVSARRRRG